MSRWGIDADMKVVLIVADRDENVYLSARNISNLKLLSATNLNVYDLLAADKVVSEGDNHEGNKRLQFPLDGKEDKNDDCGDSQREEHARGIQTWRATAFAAGREVSLCSPASKSDSVEC